MTDMPPPPPPMTPPPGYVAYGGTGAVNRNVQSIRGLVKALLILIAIDIPLSALNVVGNMQLANKARKLLDGTITEAQFKDASSLNIGSLSGIVVVPIAVLTIVWMFRMANNVRALGRPELRFAPGWAIGGWFTPPCVIYAVPWLMFRELWKASDPEIGPGDPRWKSGRVPMIVNVWWVVYGLVPLVAIFTGVNAITQLKSGGIKTHDLASTLHRFAALNIVVAVLGVIAAIVYLLMVRQLSERHMRATREI
ncbi:MAG: DUF4328 domain-containing protein [Ilumatobacteraceae bacterium]